MVRPEGSVDVCPVNKEAWDARAEAKKTDCGGASVYHCLSDMKGWKWEKCVEKTLISEGYIFIGSNCIFFSKKLFFPFDILYIKCYQQYT